MAIPVAGQLEKLFSNFYRLCAPNPGPMTGPGTNTYIYGNKELAVFDPGPPLAEHVNAILQAQEELGAPITHIFSSHTHQDHSPAVALLVEHLPDVKIIGQAAAPDQEFEDRSFVPTDEPIDGQRFEFEAGLVQAIYTPGHVANHFCFLIEEHACLTTGDHLMNGSTVVIIPPKGNMRDYIDSLRKMQNYSIDVMAPGHGDLIENPNEVVAWTIDHRLQREAKVVAALRTDLAQSIERLVSTVYDDVDISLHGIAALSLHAHLIKLELDERASEDPEGWRLLV